MKNKNFILIALLATLLFASQKVNAQTKSKVRLTQMSGTTNGPNNLIGEEDLIVIEAEYDSQELTLSVTNYAGNVDILIFKTLGHNIMYDDTDYISETCPVTVDISSYTLGTYTLVVELGSGDTYIGDIIIE